MALRIFVLSTLEDSACAEQIIHGCETLGYQTRPRSQSLRFHESLSPTNQEQMIVGSAVCILLWSQAAAQSEEVERLLLFAQRLQKNIIVLRLITKYTQRYRWLSTPAQIKWFEQVTALAVIRKMMEAKYHAWTYEHNEHAFVDAWCSMEMRNLMALSAMTTEIAKAIHHIVKQPEQAKEMLEQLFDMQATRLRENPFQMRQPLPPLPSLPEGVALPQALLPRITQQTEEAEVPSLVSGKE
ncbi:hypothetical protein [Ktedonobacter robiniae]|uniref:DUF4062 domain-containing protein n=1 Tax=Ktedonobacter robiniae TaxID=2778365 RepID=A0ABQ3UTJ6_9CHLR|nr:hypothetical protein [Ktedonobacter robiniae]GHO56159.1 hypothetical protein KSB_46340 [Ktedonobacter robiniae]